MHFPDFGTSGFAVFRDGRAKDVKRKKIAVVTSQKLLWLNRLVK